MNENERDQERHWERGWDGHELAEMRRLARLPLSEKLSWLEEAHWFVEQFRQQRQAGSAPVARDKPLVEA